MPRLLIVTLSAALVAACASSPPLEESATADAQAGAVPEPVATLPPERPFPDDSIYPLLVAEFALRQRQYELALENYMDQSRILRDAGVSAHTTHLTQFMRREQEALEASQLWVELDPGSAEARNTYAGMLVRQGRVLEALPQMAEVQRLGGEPRYTALLSNFEQLNPDQREELVQGINALAAEWPENTQLMLTQALVMAEFEQYSQALDKLEKLFRIEPHHGQAILLEVRILVSQEHPKPFARLEKTLRDNPDDQQLRLQYARILTATDMPAAREQFEILSAQSPRDGDLLLSLALINREIGDDPEAKAYLRQMLSLGQRVGEAHYYLGRIAEDEGDRQAAISHYMQVEGEPESLSASSRMGQILIDSGEGARARDIFQAQRQDRPEQAEDLFNLEADLFIRSGELDAAMEILDQGVSDFPDSNSLRYARSMLAEQMGDLSLMEQDLRSIIADDPDNATALNALGYTLANRTDRYGEAYELIVRALELQPDEPAILDSMGWVLYRKGKHQEALQYLTRAYADFPDPEVAAHLGEVLWVTGDTEAATRIWQAALLRDPEHKILRETLRRLEIDLATMRPAAAPPPSGSASP